MLFPWIAAFLLLGSLSSAVAAPSPPCDCEGGTLVTMEVVTPIASLAPGPSGSPSEGGVEGAKSTEGGPAAEFAVSDNGSGNGSSSGATAKTNGAPGLAGVRGIPAAGLAPALGLAGSGGDSESTGSHVGATSLDSAGSTASSGSAASTGSASASSGSAASTGVSSSPSSSSSSGGSTTSTGNSSSSTGSASTTSTTGTGTSTTSASATSKSATSTSNGPSILPSPSMWSVLYDDRFSDTPSDNIVTNPSLMAGYNTYILAFYTTYAPVKAPGSIGGPMDSLAAWTDMTDEQRTAQKKVYRDAGVRLTFTCFGGLETKATWDAADGSALGLEIANFAKQYLFDGVDIDYEAFAFAQNSQPEAIAFLVTLIQTLRQNLPSPYIISMSVTPTWMAPGRLFSNMTGSVPDQVMGDIDYIDGMYYWGPGYWDTCDSLFTACPVLAGTSVGEILTQGVIPAEKYLVGIPQIFANSNNKFSDGVGTVLGDCLATKKGQYGGVATWKYDPAYPDWIGNVRTAAGW